MEPPEYSRRISHAFRRGATQELREAGSGWPAISSVGVWNSPDLAGYVDITPEVEAAVRHLGANARDRDGDSASAEEH